MIYSRNKFGHYDNYDIVLKNLTYFEVEKKLYKQLLNIFRFKKIVFLDFDGVHLLFFPFIIIRSLIGKKSIMFSIRTNMLSKKGIRSFIQRNIFYVIRNLKNCKILSIHKEANESSYSRYINHFIYDIQNWDLPFLKIPFKKPKELKSFQFNNTTVLLFGVLNKKRMMDEWIKFLKLKKTFNF